MKDLFIIRRHSRKTGLLNYDEAFLNLHFPSSVIRVGTFPQNYNKKRWFSLSTEWKNILKTKLAAKTSFDEPATQEEKKEILEKILNDKQAKKVIIRKILSDDNRIPKGYY